MPTIWQPYLGKLGFIATLVHVQQQHARATTELETRARSIHPYSIDLLPP